MMAEYTGAAEQIILSHNPKRWQGVKEVHVANVLSRQEAHGHTLDEVEQSLCQGLAQCGIHVSRSAFIEPQRFNIVLGAHVLPDEQLQTLSSDRLAIYNFEQVTEESAWMRPAYLDALRCSYYWDYSRQNIDRMKILRPGIESEYVQLGFSDQWKNIPKSDVQDIDVLFYGSINERRRQILLDLRAAGLSVHVAFNVYGAERDALIARSKIVLNVHFYLSRVLESVRISYLMANAKAVVSECAPDTEVQEHLRPGLCLSAYHELLDKCIYFVRHESERLNLEREALGAVEKLPMRNVLRPIFQSA